MARPSSFDREKAIEAAMQAIWRNGYEATSVKAMSEMLGITRSSYYNAFGTREDLFREVLARYFAQSPDAVLHGQLPKGPILPLITQTFREICAARAADPESRGCMALNCVAELGPDHSVGSLCTNAVLASVERFDDLLSMAVANGELPKETDTRAKALALQSLMVGINTMSKAVREEEALWTSARTTLEALGMTQVGDHAQF